MAQTDQFLYLLNNKHQLFTIDQNRQLKRLATSFTNIKNIYANQQCLFVLTREGIYFKGKIGYEKAYDFSFVPSNIQFKQMAIAEKQVFLIDNFNEIYLIAFDSVWTNFKIEKFPVNQYASQIAVNNDTLYALSTHKQIFYIDRSMQVNFVSIPENINSIMAGLNGICA